MTVPMKRTEIAERHFLELRCKVLDIAAALDRIDRAPDAKGADAKGADPRFEKLERAIRVLLEAGPGRAEKVQLIFSREYDPNWNKGS